jgi:hypothetical protein
MIYNGLGDAEPIAFKDGEIVEVRHIEHHLDHKYVDIDFLNGHAYVVDRDLFTFDV